MGQKRLTEKVKRGFVGAWRFGGRVIKICYRFTFCLIMALLVLMCYASFYDGVVGDGDIPEPNYIGSHSQYKIMAHRNTTPGESWGENNWEKLSASLEITKQICPHVYTWIVEKHKNNEIVWETEYNGLLAKYNYYDKRLFLNEAILSLRDGEKVQTYAHEWRHAQQNHGKVLRYSIAFLFVGKYSQSIVENDAGLYDSQVYIRLFE